MVSFCDFKERSNIIHNEKYDYDEQSFKNMSSKMKIICPIHGEFYQLPKDHIKGHGCILCGKEKRINSKRLTQDEFITRAMQIHNSEYDYSKVEYIDSTTKVCIICPIHGEFWQTPNNHLSKQGCPSCSKNKKITNDVFIERSNVIHNEKYDYSKVNYVNAKSKVDIICPVHGEFKQVAEFHLRGCGCPYCKESQLEKEITFILREENIKIERQKKFEWLGKQSLDFFLPEYNIAIECQGIQHFEDGHFNEPFQTILKRDKKKKVLCEDNGVKLLYYSNLHIKYPYDVIEDKNDLLKNIKIVYGKKKVD